MEAIKSNRIGKFSASFEIINQYPDNLRGVMSECIVIEANFFERYGMVVYTAISNRFEELLEGERIPFCVWETTPTAEVSGCNRVKFEDPAITFSNLKSTD